MKAFFTYLILLAISTAGWKIVVSQALPPTEDAQVWQAIDSFTNAFNAGDTLTVARLLPRGFMLQWMHENFIGKRAILNAMADTAVHTTLKYCLVHDAGTLLRYSDDELSAGLNMPFEFLDKNLMSSVIKNHRYGMCIIYLQKTEGVWRLVTLHFDLHCSLCPN